jgi:hypothetical protein
LSKGRSRVKAAWKQAESRVKAFLKRYIFFSTTTTYSQPPQPLLLKTFGMSEQSSSPVMRGFNLFSKPLLLSRRRGLTQKIAETVDLTSSSSVSFLCFGIAGHAMSFLLLPPWENSLRL